VINADTVKNKYTGSGSLLTYPVTFPFSSADDLAVYVSINDIETKYTLGTQYTVSVNSDRSGGIVAFANATFVPKDSIIAILLDIATTQDVDLTSTATVSTQDLEAGLDKTVQLVQMAFEQLGRCVKVVPTSLKTDNDLNLNTIISKIDADTEAAKSSATQATASAVAAAVSAAASAEAESSAVAYLNTASEDVSLATQLSAEFRDIQTSLDNAVSMAVLKANNAAGLAVTAADDVAALAILCQKYSDQAAMWPSGAPAFDAGATYSFPDVVVYSDASIYRCIGIDITGENPADGIHWVRINQSTVDSCWALDSDRALMPSSNASLYSSVWEIDGGLDLMPATTPTKNVSWDMDSDGDIQPIT